MGNQQGAPAEQPDDDAAQADIAAAQFQRFAGPEALPFADPAWSELLTSNFELAEFSAAQFDSVAGHFCHDLASNNLQTGNFVVLIQHLVALLDGLPDEPSMLHDMALNACFLTRMYAKYFIETMGNAALMAQLSAGTEDDVVELLVKSLIAALARMQVNAATFVVTIEIVKTLLILFSTQLNEPPQKPTPHVFMDAAMCCEESATQLLHQLFTNALMAPEITLQPESNPHDEAVYSGSILASLTTVAATVPSAILQIPMRIYRYLFSHSEPNQDSAHDSTLSEHSNLKKLCTYLLLVLLVYRPRSQEDPPATNPFTEALVIARDVNDPTAPPPEQLCRGVAVDFQGLYDELCENLETDTHLLLLYQMLWRCRAFRDFAIHVRTDIDTMVYPLAACIYNSCDSTEKPPEPLQAAQLSVALSCVLLLSESDDFNSNAQASLVENVTWCTERVLTDIPLSSLLVVVLLRAVFACLHSHTGHAGGTMCTCLAAIANMAPQIKAMHPYPAQRLVQLLEVLGKKVARLHEIQDSGSTPEESEALAEEFVFFQDLLQMLLDVFSMILLQAEPNANPHLVYTLLHRHEEALSRLRLEPFTSMAVIADYGSSLGSLISQLRDSIPEEAADVEAIHEVISTHANKLARELRSSQSAAAREKYIYDEQSGPDEFFAPYLWRVVVDNSGVKWSDSRIMLYTVQR